MGFMSLLILAIVIAAAVFGLNQIMMVAQDVKYIRSVLTSHLDKTTQHSGTAPEMVPPAPPAPPAPGVVPEAGQRPEGVPPPRNDALSAAMASASAWAEAASAMAARAAAPP